MINGITFNEDGYEWSMTPPEGKEYQCVYIYQTPEAENKKLKKQMEEMKKKMESMEKELRAIEVSRYYSTLPNDNDHYAQWIAEYIDAPEGRPKPTKDNVVFTQTEREMIEEHIDQQHEYWIDGEQEEWIRDHACEWRWDAIAEKYRNTCDYLDDDE